METVRIEALRKSFGRLEVLKGIDLSVREGEITAVLGPNASGKTTLIKSLLGLVLPDEGRILVLGREIESDCGYRESVGYMPQEPSFPENLTPGGLLEFISNIRGGVSRKEVGRLVEIFKLADFMDKPIGSLSGGTKQKISALLALSFLPKVLILDEPTVGLDPIASSRLKEEILSQRERGVSVILTSHIISEVEELADRVVLLIDGRVKADGTPQEIKERFGERNLERAIARLLETEGGKA